MSTGTSVWSEHTIPGRSGIRSASRTAVPANANECVRCQTSCLRSRTASPGWYGARSVASTPPSARASRRVPTIGRNVTNRTVSDSGSTVSRAPST
ncbi:hypothetical protein BJF79_40185 [Actinomadura sp. CNU-125]|nr:hypothetical protein BJF79_40185 [Actinomadura sp. CNU-125]